MMKAFRRKKQRIKTLDDILFENRNKGYGCYELRSTYHRRLQFSFIIAIFIFLVAIAILYFWEINPLFESSNKVDQLYFETVKYDSELLPLLVLLPDVPKEKTAPRIVASEPVIIKEQQETPNSKLELPQVKTKPLLRVADTSLNKLADILLKRHKYLLNEKSIQTDTIKMVLEKAPQFPGGIVAMQYYFFRNQQYPLNALLAGVKGSTIVSFVVNAKGMVEDAKIVSGIDPELDMEAIRLVKFMPQWKPAYYKGKPIKCMLVVPVDFSIR